MKRRIWLIILAGVLLLLGLVCWAYFRHQHEKAYIVIDAAEYPRDITSLEAAALTDDLLAKLPQLTSLTQLDLRGTELTVEQYTSLREMLPGCRILWKVPFQGQRYAEETDQLTVTSVGEDDIALLEYFPELKSVDATLCRDYEALMTLMEQRPDLEVFYTVTIGNQEYREDTKALTLENADTDELLAALPLLPELTEVTLTGQMPEMDAMSDVVDLRPEVKYYWNFTLCGVETSSTATELYLNEIPMESTEEVENALKFFHNLQWVEMCGCGISSEDMDAMQQRHPETRFVWTIRIREASIRTDIIAFIPYKIGYSIHKPLYDEDLAELKYCIDIICLDLGHMKITDYSFLANMPNMQYLVLADTPGTDFSALAGLTEMVYLEIFNTKFDDPSLLLGMTKLEDLNIGYTPLPGIEELKQMTWLKRLWMANTRLPSDVYQELCAALPDTEIQAYLAHSTSANWRDSENYREMRDLLGMYYMD